MNFLLAQDKDTLNRQVVNVVKPYQPTISDAFKVKERPKLNDDMTTKKKKVTYSIFSIPVASTFSPAKSKASKVEPQQKQRIYNNYASLGAGSYTSILGELFVSHDLNDTENIGLFVNHHSSNGGITNIILDNDFSISRANLFFSQNLNHLNWKIDTGIDLQAFNWYGTNLTLSQNEIKNFNPKQKYNTFYGRGRINFDDALFEQIKVKFTHLKDDFDSKENRLISNFKLKLPVLADGLNTKINFDYLDGAFSNPALQSNTLKYRNIILAVSPSTVLQQGDLKLNLGAKVTYYNNFKTMKISFSFYPQVKASYPLIEEKIEAFAGVEGGLYQNSYENFVNENPFISPTLFIAPTDQQYLGYIGLKGKLTNKINFSLKGSYGSEKNRALFQKNSLKSTPLSNTFQALNSFAVVYDDMTTLKISGELQVDLNQNFSLTLSTNYFTYDTKNFEYAWNLPDITGRLRLDYEINKSWFTGTSIFYTGSRKDLQTNITSSTISQKAVTTKSFFDANTHIGYRINDQFTAFVKGNNLSGQNYELWTNYPVLGIQILGGVTYQFNF